MGRALAEWENVDSVLIGRDSDFVEKRGKRFDDAERSWPLP